MTDRSCTLCGQPCTDEDFFDVDGADYCSQSCCEDAQPDPDSAQPDPIE